MELVVEKLLHAPVLGELCLPARSLPVNNVDKVCTLLRLHQSTLELLRSLKLLSEKLENQIILEPHNAD